MSWILENNAGMRNIIETIGGRVSKRYRHVRKEPDCDDSVTAEQTFTAVVLAGERASPSTDPLASAAGVASKVLVPIAGVSVIERVRRHHRAMRLASIAACWSDPPPRRSAPNRGSAPASNPAHWTWIAPTESPAASASAALEAIGTEGPIVLTTADHAFITPEILDQFCSAALDDRRRLRCGHSRAATT